MSGDRVAFLRQLPYFATVPAGELEALCRRAPERTVDAGEALLVEGEPGTAMYVVLDGEFAVTRRVRGRDVPVRHVGAGQLLGEMSLLEHRPRAASACAVVDSRVLEVAEPAFRELLEHPAAALAVVDTTTRRMRELEARLRQSQQHAALGRMAAGLMHELNNPAAAVRRGASALPGVLGELEDAAAGLARAGIDPAAAADAAGPPAAPAVDALARADREEALRAWLAARGVDAVGDLPAALVAGGWDDARLDRALAGWPAAQRPALVRWLGVRHAAGHLVDQLGVAAGRIADLVDAVRGYAHVGRTLVADLDVNTGIRDTLTILGHRLRDVEVDTDLGALPRIEGWGSELTQVWTNLIDNAVDAMGGAGRLRIATAVDGDGVVVRVTDDGPGLPPGVREHLFEPFVTTKPPGEGTGLGLHTVYDVVARHGGEVSVASEPGRTTFTVRLPPRVPHPGPGPGAAGRPDHGSPSG